MRFASCSARGRTFAALLDGDNVVPLADVPDLGAALAHGLLADPSLARDEALPLGEVELLPVVPRPGKVLCLGLNYHEHVVETGRDVPEYPVLFTKFAESLVGAGQPIVKPPETEAMDYEAELAVVVGRRIRRVPEERALDAVAGYTCANDVSMRDYQYKTHQWLQGKAWERSTPLGPFLVTPDEVGDPHALELRCEVNGRELQRSSTSLMMFRLPTVLATISQFVTLEPGDVILTGTPSGVGFRREPKVLLQPGDRVVVEIERVGRLENDVVAEPPA